MTTRRFHMFCFALCGALFTSLANAQNDEFTGDTKLSCEAILCLSSGTRPSECDPALSRYFGIKKKKTSDTIRARQDFLSICPVVSEDPKMAERVREIANGAGRCDADFLNKTLREVWVVKEKASCPGTSHTKKGIVIYPKCQDPVWNIVAKERLNANHHPTCNEYESSCRIRQIVVIQNKKPSYCMAYEESKLAHEMADVETLGAIYSGDPWSGGKWVEKR